MPDRPVVANAFAVFQDNLEIAERRIVDIGTGTGKRAAKLAKLGGDVLGVEPDRKKVAAANAAYGGQPGLRFLQGGAEQVPVTERSVDIATYFNSFHHVPKDLRGDAIRELTRILKPAGLAYIQEPVAMGSYYEIMKLIDDEAEPYRDVQKLLDEAVAVGRLRQTRTIHFMIRHRLSSLEDMVDKVIAVDNRRQAAFDANRAAFADYFDRYGVAEGNFMIFDQNYLVRIMGV